MSANQRVVFLDGKSFNLSGYAILERRVALRCDDPQENLSGFRIVNAGGEVIFGGLDYKYRWDVIDQRSDTIYYTNDPDYRQTEPWPDLRDIQEQAEPLSNEELTEAVADLMYETSLAQLGL